MMYIKSDTISFAWYQLLRKLNLANKTDIQKGSYANDDYRLQFDAVGIEIEKPYYDMIPVLPVGCEKLQPTTQEYVEEYFDKYIMGVNINSSETYTYGSRIVLSIERIIKSLKENPFNNQMIIDVSFPFDIDRDDPPCMRLIDLKVNSEKGINLHTYFRSWELWAGFPTNLAALEMLRQYLSYECGFEVEKGKIFAYSSGLHIYGENVKNVEATLKKEIM